MESSGSALCAEILTLYGGSSGEQDRRAASAALEGFLISPASIELLLHQLEYVYKSSVPPEQADLLVFGFLALLDQWQHRHLTSSPMATQVEIRRTILRLMCENAPRSAKLQLIKYSKILAAIAVSHFPEHWPFFLTDLMHLWASSDSELVIYASILILENVLEDCVNADFATSLPSSRRRDILDALLLQKEELISFAFNWISAYYARQDNVYYAIISKEVIKLFTLLVPLVKPHELCKEPHDVTQLIFAFLTSSTYQMETLDLLSAVSLHSLTAELFTALLQGLPRVSYYVSSEESERHQFLLSLSESLHSILSINIFQSFLLNDGGSPTVHPQFTDPLVTFLSFLGSYILSYPSLTMIAEASAHWIRLLKEPLLFTIPQIDLFFHSFTSTFIQRLARLQWEDGVAVDAVSQLDFEDKYVLQYRFKVMIFYFYSLYLWTTSMYCLK